jgi:hypothetical protein
MENKITSFSDAPKPKYKIGDLVVAKTNRGECPVLLYRQIISAWYHLDEAMNRGWEYSLKEDKDTAYAEKDILYKL